MRRSPLDEGLRWLRQYDAEFGDKSRSWSLLDGYYIPTRYPNGLPDGIPADVYTRAAAEQAGQTRNGPARSAP
jgi:HEPN domain-containing protein